MGKRGADKQITQDDDDAILGGNEGIAGSPFRKATAATISKRRIIKTSSKWKQAKPSGGGGVGNPKPGGAFSGFNFGSSYSNNPTPPPKSTDRPLFAMPTLPETSTLAPTISTTNAPNFSSTSNDEAVAKLVEGFKSYINKMGGKRLSLELPVSRFMTTYLELTRKPKLADTETKEAANSSSSSSSAEKASKPLFPSVSLSKPSPVPFSFPGAAPALSFGAAKANTTTTAPTTTTTTSVSSPAPAPFSFSSKSPPVAPISAPATAAAAAASSSIASSENSEKKEESTVLEEGDADKDWETVHLEERVAVYHYRTKNDQGEDVLTKFADGGIKIQKHKQNDGNRRMVMRNVTGKVILNLSISEDMTFDKRTGGKGGARIMFYGLRDADYGNELLLIRCKKDEVDAFHAQLVGMTK